MSACASKSTHDVDLTMAFDSTVTDSVLAEVSTLVVHTSGDETSAVPISLGRAAMRTESIIYRPSSSTHSLAVAVDASDANGTILAHGSAAAVTLAGATKITITLSAGSVSITDMGNVDGGATGDMAFPPQVPPVFGSLSSASSATATNTITINQPPNAAPNNLLIATVAAQNMANGQAVLFGSDPGWTQLTSASAEAPNPGTLTLFWRYASTSEPSSYTFSTNTSANLVGSVQAYQGAYAVNGSPFDVTITGGWPNATNTQNPPLTPTAHYDLVLFQAFAVDDVNDTFSTPSGFNAHSTSQLLIADRLQPEIETISAQLVSISTSSRTLVVMTSIFAAPPNQ